MFSPELRELLIQVIKSWQVIAVSLALVVYIYLVKYVSRRYHRPRMSRSRPKRAKRTRVKTEAAKPQHNPDELIIE
jgi:hypothetical protein